MAIFENGVLKPKEPLDLPATASVRLTIEVLPSAPLTVAHLTEFLGPLPPLGDDAESFARDVEAIRMQFPAEPTGECHRRDRSR